MSPSNPGPFNPPTEPSFVLVRPDGTLAYVPAAELGYAEKSQPVEKPPTAAKWQHLTLGPGGVIMDGSTPFRTAGVNAFQLINNDYPQPRLMTHAEIDTLLDACVAMGVRMLRAHTMGINVGSGPMNLITGVTGSGASTKISYNDKVWDVMDYAVAGMRRRGIRLTVPMTDEHGPYHGGKRNWVNFRFPGRCSTNPSVNSASSRPQRDAENVFYAEPVLSDFKQFITDFLTHYNPYTKLAYRDDPTVAKVETGNELWTSVQDAPTWVIDICRHIKTVAPRVLTQDGGGTDGQTLNPLSLASPYVDCLTTHPYEMFGIEQVKQMAAQCAAANKAFPIEEGPWSKPIWGQVMDFAETVPNVPWTLLWSLQNNADLHYEGAPYGSKDVALYWPGKDDTQRQFIARFQRHAAAMDAGPRRA